MCEFNLETSENVRRDRELFASSSLRTSPLYVRIHSFRGKSATIGALSRPGKKILDWFQTFHIPIERRVTGGGIALHGNDLCLSFFINRKVNSQLSVSNLADQVKSLFSRCLEESLPLPLSPLDFTISGGNSGDFCFMGRGKHDILLGGVKVGGIAGKAGRRSLLMHVQINSIGWDEELVRKLTGFECTFPKWQERLGALIFTKGFIERIRYEIEELFFPLIRGDSTGDYCRCGVKVIGNL